MRGRCRRELCTAAKELFCLNPPLCFWDRPMSAIPGSRHAITQDARMRASIDRNPRFVFFGDCFHCFPLFFVMILHASARLCQDATASMCTFCSGELVGDRFSKTLTCVILTPFFCGDTDTARKIFISWIWICRNVPHTTTWDQR